MSAEKKQLLAFSLFFVLYESIIYLSNDMIMPAMLQVVADFHARNSDIALSLSLYLLGGSSLQIVLGPLVERLGKRRVMLVGNLLFLFATSLIPFAASMDQFLAARFFQGMGSCFIFIGYAVIHESFDDVEAVKLTTILANVAIFAPLIGPVVGSTVVSYLHWQYVFALSFAVGLLTLLGLYRTMPAGQPAGTRFDLRAAVRSYGRIFRCPTFLFGIVLAGIALVPLTAWIGLSPAIVMDTMHASYGVYIAYQCLIFSGFILATFAVQWLGDRLPLAALIRGGGALAVLGMSGFGLLHAQPLVFIGGMFLFSVGFGLFNGALIRLAMTATGEPMGMTSAAMSLLYCVVIAAGLEAYNRWCDAGGYTLASYAAANIPVGIVVFIGLLCFLRLQGRGTVPVQAQPVVA